MTPKGEGAFYVTTDGSGSNSYDAANSFNLRLDASRSSSIFGETTTVQPASLRLFACIKI